MTSKFAMAFGAALLLMLPGGAAFAQPASVDQDSFYADPVLSDPPLKPEHVFAAAVATEDVATVAPAVGEVKPDDAKPVRTSKNAKPTSGCTALNPCAVPTPAARS